MLGSKTVWISGAIRGGRRYGTPKLKIPVFPHYNPPVTFKFPLEFGGYLLKIPVNGGDALK